MDLWPSLYTLTTVLFKAKTKSSLQMDPFVVFAQVSAMTYGTPGSSLSRPYVLTPLSLAA
uniref:Uncharacterized protein n=1 Tax=Tetranychus urticae TaxID=32264 RepID=T1K4B2_TETUR